MDEQCTRSVEIDLGAMKVLEASLGRRRSSVDVKDVSSESGSPPPAARLSSCCYSSSAVSVDDADCHEGGGLSEETGEGDGYGECTAVAPRPSVNAGRSDRNFLIRRRRSSSSLECPATEESLPRILPHTMAEEGSDESVDQEEEAKGDFQQEGEIGGIGRERRASSRSKPPSADGISRRRRSSGAAFSARRSPPARSNALRPRRPLHRSSGMNKNDVSSAKNFEQSASSADNNSHFSTSRLSQPQSLRMQRRNRGSGWTQQGGIPEDGTADVSSSITEHDMSAIMATVSKFSSKDETTQQDDSQLPDRHQPVLESKERSLSGAPPRSFFRRTSMMIRQSLQTPVAAARGTIQRASALLAGVGEDDGSSEDDGKNARDLLNEAQDFLTMSMLIYIYAKLREMSILGYTKADFRAVDCNSHMPWEPDAPASATVEGDGCGAGNCGGGNRKTRTGRRVLPRVDCGLDLDDSSNRSLLQSSMHYSSIKTISSNGDDSVSHEYLRNTKSAAFIIQTVLAELESEKRERVSGDDNADYSSVIDEHDISIVKEFRAWVDDSRSDQLDEVSTNAIIELRRKVARARWKRAITATRLTVRLKLAASKAAQKKAAEGGAGDKDTGNSAADDENDIESRENIRTSVLRRRGALLKTNSVKGDWFKLQRRLVEDHFGVSNSEADVTLQDGTRLERNKTEAALASQQKSEVLTNDMIEDVMKNSLPSYFKDGSALRRMCESGIEVAWFGDRHPKEAIYSICVCRAKKEVTVVFRGTVTAHNWVHNLKVMMSEELNPLADEQYAGRTDAVSMHTGFSLYLLKRRRDDRRKKLDEIFSKVRAIGEELSPDGQYRVSVAGHSLGGALATLFSFYTASREEFTRVGPVRVFTFAAPRVGDRRFADAYRHLERTGRVLHARFSNCRDIVPLTPTHTFAPPASSTSRRRKRLLGLGYMEMYCHVGLQVRLHETNWLGQLRTRKALDVSYAKSDDWLTWIEMAWKNNFFSNLNTLGGFGRAHSLSMHQRRLHFAREYRLGLGLSELYFCKRRRKLKTLEEYYSIKANVPEEETGILPNKKRMEDTRRNVLCIVFVLAVAFSLRGRLSCHGLTDWPVLTSGLTQVTSLLCDFNRVGAFNQVCGVGKEMESSSDNEARNVLDDETLNEAAGARQARVGLFQDSMTAFFRSDVAHAGDRKAATLSFTSEAKLPHMAHFGILGTSSTKRTDQIKPVDLDPFISRYALSLSRKRAASSVALQTWDAQHFIRKYLEESSVVETSAVNALTEAIRKTG